jgi:hypothetical protein
VRFWNTTPKFSQNTRSPAWISIPTPPWICQNHYVLNQPVRSPVRQIFNISDIKYPKDRISQFLDDMRLPT